MQKFSDVRGFKDVRMNLDSSPEMLAPNEVGMVRNMIEENSSGRLVNMRGFDSVMAMTINTGFTMPVGDFKCVGTTKDINAGTIIYFLADVTTDRAKADRKHCILRMFTSNKKLEWILYSQYLLNFQYNYRVSASTIDDLLYFTDGYEGTPFVDYNPPRKVNMVKAAGMTNPFNGSNTYQPGMVVSYLGKSYRCLSVTSAYPLTGTTVDIHWETANVGVYSALTWHILDRIKWPPAYAPGPSYDDDANRVVNKLHNKLFQFSYRYVYDDNEKSVWSPPSIVPLPSRPELLNGAYNEDIRIDNVINVWVNTGVSEVKTIEISVRVLNTGNWQLIKRIYKYDSAGERETGMLDDINVVYLFYDDDIAEGLTQTECNRPYDAVPQISAHNEIIEKNRIVDGNYIEGYDNTNIDVALSVASQQVTVGKIIKSIDNTAVVSQQFGCSQGDQFYGGSINLLTPTSGVDFWEPGFTYVIQISCLPGRYNNPEPATWHPITYPPADEIAAQVFGSFWDEPIHGYATVVASSQMSLKDFIEEACAQLRVRTTYGRLITLDAWTFKGFGGVSGLYDAVHGSPGTPPVDVNSIGFIIEVTNSNGNPWGTCVNCSKVDVEILKLSNNSVLHTFKSGSHHPFGIVYKDRANRKSTVNTSTESIAYVPSQVESQTEHRILQNTIKWEINHLPPIWATHYQWVYARNSSISYYIYASIVNISNTAYTPNVSALHYTSININEYIVQTKHELTKFNLSPYDFVPGDRIRFILNRDGSDYKTFPFSIDTEILGVFWPDGATGYQQDTSLETDNFIRDGNGNKIRSINTATFIIGKINFSGLGISKDNTIVEIYRPNNNTERLVYYDFGPPLPILNPHTDNRFHSFQCTPATSETNAPVTNSWNRDQTQQVSARGTFTYGDAYVGYRQMHNCFPVERNSYSDFYNSDAINIGLYNIEFRDARRTKYVSKLLYSGLFIQDTRINNLSHVDSSDSVTLAEKYGPINHIEEVGFTLKILQTSKQSSLYIGRAGVTQPSSESKEILSSTKDVLGTLIVHDSDFGTVHPGSVVKNETRAYFFDFNSHAICRDDGNGIQNLCVDYNINSFMHEACTAFGSADNVDVIASFDQENSLVIWTFTDKTTASNSFTLAFRDTGGSKQDGFVAFFDFMPDEYGFSKKVITSFSGNELWVHNSNTAPRSNFYGVQYPYWVTVVLNKLLLIFKRWLTIFVGSSKKFSAPVAGDISIPATDNNPIGMMSLLKAGAFTSVNGKFVAEFGKNMTTRSLTPAISDLVDGDDLQGQSLSVKLQGEETTEHKLLSVEVTGVAL